VKLAHGFFDLVPVRRAERVRAARTSFPKHTVRVACDEFPIGQTVDGRNPVERILVDDDVVHSEVPEREVERAGWGGSNRGGSSGCFGAAR